jgi:hypothetical protein
MNMTGLFDMLVISFFRSLSPIDYFAGVLLFCILMIFISSWNERSNESLEVLKEIRDNLEKTN